MSFAAVKSASQVVQGIRTEATLKKQNSKLDFQLEDTHREKDESELWTQQPAMLEKHPSVSGIAVPEEEEGES